MKRKKISIIVGTRPNFIKISSLVKELNKKRGFFDTKIIHTGQHYNYELSGVFFSELKIPEPDYNLNIGSGTHAWQMSKMIEKLEPLLKKENPDLMIVVGDVNSTLAGALVAAKLKISIAHIESGLRSFDKNMPEEINRILTDHLADYLFASEPSGVKNLLNEGISRKKIFLVGNIMIDTLLRHKNKVLKTPILKKMGIKEKNYAVLTLHRAENVDDKKTLGKILKVINELQKRVEIIWPIHPRTKKRLREFNFAKRLERIENLKIKPPLGYFEMLSLINNSKLVLTDSGGIQEEATFFKIPCLTLRNNTERPITVELGTNIITGTTKESILYHFRKIAKQNFKIKSKIPPKWDGKTSQRIVDILSSKL